MPRPITATYRLQLNADFTLRDAAARVPYLHALGVSHLYLSPVLAARRGSTHGYDVADPTQVGAELGGDDALVALAETAQRHGMGLILDIVPNHMGIGADNPYWEDLLAHGQASAYAGWFDVEWKATRRTLAGKVLLPVLGDTLAHVLARGELGLSASETGVRVTYYDQSFPLDPASLPPELVLAQRDPSARELLGTWTAGDDGGRRFAGLLAAQHYELAFWRTASRDINYRRFFDVNELIALRVEREDVFEATHRHVLQLVADGVVDGLRVDHIDGLLAPRRYLERLRAAVDARQPRAAGEPRFPIFVEKILAPGEVLPADWPVDGTTGYEFMVALEDLFVDPAGHARLEAGYGRRAMQAGFHEIALDAKRRVLRGALNADVRRIAPMLAGVARRAGWTARSVGAYAIAIVELVAALPVYRTYLDAEQPEPSDADRAVLVQAFAAVRARRLADGIAVDALELALLGRWGGGDVDPALARARLAFVLRWQQLTGPAAAKGVEDTALYVYAPLASRNEVGGDPGVPLADARPRFEALLVERASRHPRSLNATNTHDTKRSADVRSRLDALSEHAREWQRQLAHWRRYQRDTRTLIKGKLAPTRTTDNFIFQSLVGLWPQGAAGAPGRDADPAADQRALDALRERITAYMQKSVREAKVRTSWRDPDAEYEAAVTRFIEGLLDRRAGATLLRAMEQFVARIAPQGVWNALARVTLHLTAPGTPDLYQGDELWFQALVDPDNRRPVDWGAREQALAAVQRDAGEGDAAELLREVGDGRLKMHIISRLLRFRRDHAPMMTQGSVAFVERTGEHRDRLVSYERAHGEDRLLVVAPRLTCGLGEGAPTGARWGDTSLELPAGGRWRCLLSGREVAAVGTRLRVADLLATLPVAALVRVD